MTTIVSPLFVSGYAFSELRGDRFHFAPRLIDRHSES